MTRAKADPPARARFQYVGGFDAIDVRAGGDWITATRGDIVTVTGTQYDSFNMAADFTQVDDDGNPINPPTKSKTRGRAAPGKTQEA